MATTHGTEVSCFELAVDELSTMFAENGGQLYEGVFRGVGHQREHALTEEDIADVDTIEASHQLFIVPYFDAGGEALSMEFSIGADDIGAEPSTFLLIAVLCRCATAHDALEVAVDAHVEMVFVNELAHGMADVYFVGEDDETVKGAEPQRLCLVFIRVPREKAEGVGQQQAVDTEVAPHSYQSVGLTQSGVGEPKIFV